MRSIALLLAAAVTLLEAQPVRALDPVTGSLIAVGAYVGTGMASQATTYSRVNVKVEVFRDSIPIGKATTPIGPFTLNQPLAISGALAPPDDAAPTLDGLVKTSRRVASLMPHFSTAVQGLKDAAAHAADIAQKDTGNGKAAWQALADQTNAVVKAGADATAAIDAFRDAISETLKQKKVSPQDLSDLKYLRDRMRAAILAFRDRLAVPPEPVISSVESSLDALIASLPAASQDTINKDAPRTANAVVDELPRIVLRSARVVQAIDKSDQAADAKKQNTAFVVKRLNDLGVDVKAEDLMKYTSLSAVRRDLPHIFLVQEAADVANDLLTATYVGVTISSSFGPITSDVVQGVFSPSFIDKVASNPKAWKKWNQALSDSHEGDHNAVIYMDNMLTPILKDARFDPSNFIAANAEAYKKAFSIVASVYGVPAPGATGSSADYNLLNSDAREKNAADALTSQKTAADKALTAVATQAKPVTDALDTDPTKWKGGDGKSTVKDVVTQLRAAADALDKKAKEK
jgi:hypothetical protein